MHRNTLLLKENKLLSKTLLLLILAIATLMLAACDKSNSPEQVVTNFYKAIEKNDPNSGMQLIYIPRDGDARAQQAVTGKLVMMFGYASKEMEAHKGIKNIKINKAQYSEDKKQAKITVMIEYSDGVKLTQEITTINHDGKWLIKL